MAQFQLGSISTGTLRTEDLLEAFHSTIESLQAQQAKDEGTPIVLADDGYMDGNEPYSDEELLTIYTEQLESFCPPFVYFGTLEGDGADFGFWPDTYSLGDALQDTWDGESSSWDWNLGYYTLVDPAVIVQVSDHGNVTVMDMERNVLWSVV